MKCHIIEGGGGNPEMNSMRWRPLSESLGEKQQETRLTNPQCLVLFIPSHKISLGSMLSRNLCGLVKEKVSRVSSGSRAGTYSYLVSERGQTVWHRASAIFCRFSALLPWSFGTVGLVNPFSVHVNTEVLGWELWRRTWGYFWETGDTCSL